MCLQYGGVHKRLINRKQVDFLVKVRSGRARDKGDVQTSERQETRGCADIRRARDEGMCRYQKSKKRGGGGGVQISEEQETRGCADIRMARDEGVCRYQNGKRRGCVQILEIKRRGCVQISE